MAHHHHQQKTSSIILLLSTMITFGFAAIEAIGGFLAHSLALWSDAGHMAVDALSLLFAFIIALMAKRPPCAKLSYGYSRAEVLGAIISSAMLMVTVIVIVIEAFRRLYTPPVVNGSTVVIIAIIGLVINLLVAWLLSCGEQNFNTRAAILHVLSDAIASIAALIVGIVILLTAWTPIDPILSLFIALLILIGSIRLWRETVAVLMEGVPATIDLPKVGLAMANMPEIVSVHDLHIWTLSSGQIMLTAHVIVYNLGKWPTTLHALNQMLANTYHIHHITLQPITNEFPLAYLPHKWHKPSH